MLSRHRAAANRTITVMVVGLVFAAIFASTASANSVGQCGGEVSTGLQLYENWKNEGVASEAAGLVGKPAGFKEMDGSFRSFMKKRVGRMKLAETVTIEDFGCSGGSIFGAGTRTLAKGESVMAALPKKYSMKEVSLTPRRGYERIAVSVHVVGKVECSNPFRKKVTVYIYVPVTQPPPHKKRPPKKCGCHKKKPHPKCSTKSPNGGGGNCNNQTVTVTPKQECPASNHSGTNCAQTVITVVSNCSNVSMENTGDVNQGGNCNNGGTETCVGQENCNTETSPPPCGCKEEPKKAAPEIAIEAINDFETNEETVICARVTAPVGNNLSVTFFAENGGQFANQGIATKRSGTTNEWCGHYTAPSEVPPGGCDIIKAVVQDNTTGLSGKDEKKAPIKPETF